MKTHIKLLTGAALALAAATPHASAQTATTDPVGYITIDTPVPTGSGVRYSIVSSTLLNPVVYQGKVTAISGTTLTLEGAALSAAAQGPTTVKVPSSSPTHYAELVAPDAATTNAKFGAWANISAVPSATQVTAAVAGVAVGDTIRIRKHVTVSDLFGADNSKGKLKPTDDNAATPDEVLLVSSTGTMSFVYYTGTGSGWYLPDFSASVDDLPIEPQQGVLLKRVPGATNASFVHTGHVKTGQTKFPMFRGFNVLGIPRAVGSKFTLGTSGLFNSADLPNSIKPQTTNTSDIPDDVFLLSSAGTTSFIYYYDPLDIPSNGWYLPDFSGGFKDSQELTEGSGLLINHRTGTSFTWTIPQETISQ